jgi:rRNA maturation endonuclease Nob1
MALFRNHYRCYQCQSEWDDVWSATCDDDCPSCGARHVSPTFSKDEENEADAVCHDDKVCAPVT